MNSITSDSKITIGTDNGLPVAVVTRTFNLTPTEVASSLALLTKQRTAIQNALDAVNEKIDLIQPVSVSLLTSVIEGAQTQTNQLNG